LIEVRTPEAFGRESLSRAENRGDKRLLAEFGFARSDDDLAIVGHGGTGALLYCHLAGLPISRSYDLE
jgi:broad specificity phosphatase PhoE